MSAYVDQNHALSLMWARLENKLYNYKKERKTKNRSCALFLAEKEGFEPSRRVTDLLVFEARPFSHLGTSPKISYI